MNSFSLLYKHAANISEEKCEEYKVRKFTPKFFNLFISGEKRNLKGIIARLYFYLIAGKKYIIYYVLSPEGKPIHTSTVMPKCLKFQYLKRNECEIGPCYTAKDFRGKGIYPCVLKYILANHDAEMFYMTVHKNNTSSIRGIEKAGFSSCGYIQKSKLFKIYRLAQEENK